ncbi:MAG: GGDEF domain-containing protein [Rhizobiaceae bacterium]|nr:GGDEF domain-containing protein [Rhizobiaceae bacterium]
MRLHKSEAAFFVFVAVILAAGIVIFHAYDLLFSIAKGLGQSGRFDDIVYVSKLLFGAGLLLATGLFFGLFFIFPLIRRQVKEENKLRAMTETLSVHSRNLERAALTDGLTGMQNRRYFDEALKEYLDEFRRVDKPVGLMIVDLDHFKQINDTHGHDVGDEVLKAVGNCLRDMTRYHDVVARLGGEEFAVVAPNMEMETMMRFAERIRKAIGGMAIVSGNVRLKVTASVGIAIWDRKETADALYRRADQQLYQAKNTGRNRVCA